MLHRVVAAAVGVLLLYTLHRGRRLGMERLGSGGTILMIFSYLGIVVFLTQVFIGAVAIWTHFPVPIRASHIGLATAVWGIMVVVALISYLRVSDDQLVLSKARVPRGSAPASAPQETD